MQTAKRRAAIKTIKQSRVTSACRHDRVGDVVIFDVLGAGASRLGATEAAAREDDFNGEAFLIVPG
jgi:hypothetical protein